MASFREGEVVKVLDGDRNRDRLVRLSVAIDGEEIEAIGYPPMLGSVATGNRVVVNTTSIELSLGTGGVGFVLWNLDGSGPRRAHAGHIMKMRYTPWQMDVLAVEAPESPHHDVMATVDSIDGMPVVACGLHSQIAGVAAGVRAARPDARVAYLMSDAGALSLRWSELVFALERSGLIQSTCTFGHAFGGELEAINVFSGLAALRTSARADVTIVAMGPGIVGTDTVLGFSGIEQGQVLDAATALGGSAVACLRISFADPRSRHQGLSHHSATALGVAARERCTVVVPELPKGQTAIVLDALDRARLTERHDVVTVDGAPGIRVLEDLRLRPTSMGRGIDETPEFWLAASAAGAVAAAKL